MTVSPHQAFELEVAVLARLSAARTQWVPLAASLYSFHSVEAWKARDSELTSFKAWLAQPEIGLAYRTAKDMVDAFGELVIERDVSPERLVRLDPSKVAVVIPALRAGDVEVEVALGDVEALSRSDLRIKYRAGAEDALDAEREPAWCRCECGNKHRRAS